MSIKIDWDNSRRQGMLSGDHFDEIRERFSVSNKAAKFARWRGRFIPSRIYAITPAGRFEVGLYDEIQKFCIEQQYSEKLLLTENFVKQAAPSYTVKELPKLKLKLRDYQKNVVDNCLKSGRGTVVLATAGGKTLTIATLLESLYEVDKDFTCALIVPDLGLVNQTYDDFVDYGANFSYTKWTGSHKLDLSTNVIICNIGILQSSKSNVEWMTNVDVCVIDEVHKLRRGNKINKIIKQIRTPHRFGFTGTMPEEYIDQWNIIGKIGPIIYERSSYELRNDNYISDVKVQILKLDYAGEPKYVRYPGEQLNPTDRYRRELDFIIHNNFRNNVLGDLCNKLDKNGLIMVDYIEHGEILQRHLQLKCPDKRVYFIRGEVDVEDRDKVKKIMEEEDNVVVVAISKIFSTGINIKNLHYIVFGSGGKAKIKTIQSIGRGLRLHKNKSKLIIFDFADNLQYGIQHLQKRIQLYQKENIEYGLQKIRETSS
tara:strand:+ start:3556 stop:5007 length:1452 start_codon:yes stop_codon:yes gene_type:complete